MISRHWCGVAKPSRAQAYIEHLKDETFPKLATIPGFVRASILQRNVSDGVEFLVVTHWTSMQAVKTFAGMDAHAAVVPAKVQKMMIRYDRQVNHYEVLTEFQA